MYLGFFRARVIIWSATHYYVHHVKLFTMHNLIILNRLIHLVRLKYVFIVFSYVLYETSATVL